MSKDTREIIERLLDEQRRRFDLAIRWARKGEKPNVDTACDLRNDFDEASSQILALLAQPPRDGLVERAKHLKERMFMENTTNPLAKDMDDIIAALAALAPTGTPMSETDLKLKQGDANDAELKQAVEDAGEFQAVWLRAEAIRLKYDDQYPDMSYTEKLMNRGADALESLKAQVEGHEAALRFYADPESYIDPPIDGDADYPVISDGGEIARARLKAKEGK